MKKLFLTGLCLSCLLVACSSCKEDPEPITPTPPIDYTKLPEATQTGANTFGCKVNGKVWVPRVPILFVTNVQTATVHEKDNTGRGRIECNLIDNDEKIDNWFVITFGHTLFEPITMCEPLKGVGAIFGTTNGEYYKSDYHLSTNNCVTITRIDTAKNIISGTFQFVVYNDTINLNDKIVITDGRFDMPYYQQ